MPTLRPSVSIAFSPNFVSGTSLLRYAEEIERLGFHAIYFTDHFLHQGPSLHSVSAAAAISTITQDIRIGFAAYVLPLRHPIQAANEFAMLDQLSGGRLIAGVAAGSHEPEFEAFGLPFQERGAMLTEGIEALQTLWTQERAQHSGRYYQFSDVFVQPPAVQDPHPPIWVGSWAGPRKAADRIARYAQGWQSSGLHTTVDEVSTGWQAIEAACARIGRDPGTIGRAYVNMVTRIEDSDEEAWAQVAPRLREQEELRLIGSPDTAVRKLDALVDAGIEEVSFLVQGWETEQLRRLTEDVLPRVNAVPER